MAQAGIETPDYEVLEKRAQNVEIRRLAPSKWVVASDQADYSRSDLFGKLFNYIQGENTTNDKIKMTVPVLVDYKNPGRSGSRMQMNFYLPKKFHTNPPFPIGQSMYIRDEPATVYAVITYRGYSSPETIMSHQNALVKNLGDSAKYFDCVNYSTAGYNAPFEPVQTHEVWLRMLQ